MLSPASVEDLLLVPGNRADVLVTAALGESTLKTLYYHRGNMAGMMGQEQVRNNGQGQDGIALATLSVSGEHAAPPSVVPAQQAPADLRASSVAPHRQLTFATGGMGMGIRMISLTINGREFDETRTDSTVAARTVEEWTLTNSSPCTTATSWTTRTVE